MAIIFLHGPVIILILFNVTLSVMTGWHIYKEKKNACREWSNSKTQNQIRNQTK